jgi:hypothetical protein
MEIVASLKAGGKKGRKGNIKIVGWRKERLMMGGFVGMDARDWEVGRGGWKRAKGR